MELDSFYHWDKPGRWSGNLGTNLWAVACPFVATVIIKGIWCWTLAISPPLSFHLFSLVLFALRTNFSSVVASILDLQLSYSHHGHLAPTSLPATRGGWKRNSQISWNFIFSQIGLCSNGVLLQEKTSQHPIRRRLWCFLHSSSVDLAFRPAASFTNSLTITKLTYSI
jgi:hypothetical protein